MSSSSSAPVTKHCLEHTDEELKLYCETCEELVCLKCAIRDDKHQSHDYEELSKIFEKYKEEMVLSLVPLQDQVSTIKEAPSVIDMSCEEILKQQEAVLGRIRNKFGKLREVLSAREMELIDQLDQITQKKLEALQTKKNEIDDAFTRSSRCLHTTMES